MALSQTPRNAGSALRELIIGAQGEEGDQPLLAPAVARLIATEIGTFPIASSSSGFTYAFDPGLGIPVLTTKSFGPTFIERPETAGRGRWAFGVTAQHTTWQSIDGFNLKHGDLQTQKIFEEGRRDLFQSFIDLSTTITVFALSRGLTDRLDVGVSVPFVIQSVSGQIVSPPGFGGNRTVGGTSTGAGDLGLRAKVNIVRAREIGLSAAAEIRVPTGDDAQLLGIGRAAYRILVIASARSGILASHLNIGYTAAGHGFPADLGGFRFAQSSIDAATGTALSSLLVELQNDNQPITQVIANLVTTEISTFPTASSSAGFTYTFDRQLGLPVLTTKSFGPLFAERPETAGRGQIALNVDVQHMRWRSIDRLGLNNGDLSRGNPPIVQSFINLRSTTAMIGVTAGLTDRIDVGANVPFVRTDVSGHYTFFSLLANIAGKSQGIGDVTLRSKLRLLGAEHSGASASVELRLPTGDAAQLLGVGKRQVRLLFIAQEHGDVVSHHVNVGYTFAGRGAPPNLGLGNLVQHGLEPSDEINYSAGVDVAAGRRVTVSGDLLGRALRNTQQVSMAASGVLTPVHRNLLPLLVVVAGAKVNVVGQWLLRASVLVPITDNGLKPAVTPLIGLERAF